MPKAKPQPIDPSKRFKRKLPVELSSEDRIRIATEIAEHESEIDRLKEAVALLNADKKEHRGKRRNLCTFIREGKEPRDVECYWSEDPTAKTRTLIRLDTGEVMESVTMTPDELQEALGFDGPSNTETDKPQT